jgi:hypothetical protein
MFINGTEFDQARSAWACLVVLLLIRPLFFIIANALIHKSTAVQACLNDFHNT